VQSGVGGPSSNTERADDGAEPDPPPIVLLQVWAVEKGGLGDLASALGPDREVHVLGLPSDNDPVPVDTDGWVAWHRASLADLGLEPPYRLAGYSLGGIFAMELARALAADGVDAEPVIMIDTELPIPRPRGTRERVRHHADRLRRLPVGRWPAYVRGRVHVARRIAPKRIRLAARRTWARLRGRHTPTTYTEFYGIDAVAKSARLAYLRYQPRRYDGRVALLTSDAWVSRALGDPVLGWGEFLPNVDTGHLTGDHWTLFEEPNLTANARAIRAVL
jgi:thioesterase domain-containing protein